MGRRRRSFGADYIRSDIKGSGFSGSIVGAGWGVRVPAAHLLTETRQRRRLPELEPDFADGRPHRARDLSESEDFLLDRLPPVLPHARPDDDEDVVGADRSASRLSEHRSGNLDLIEMRFVRKKAVSVDQSS